MKRKKHPKKEIEEAIQYAENKGWHYKQAGRSAHAWGKLFCPLRAREGCSMSIWSTPRDSAIHAKQICKRVNACLHDRR